MLKRFSSLRHVAGFAQNSWLRTESRKKKNQLQPAMKAIATEHSLAPATISNGGRRVNSKSRAR
jgi:hypothetical protein